MSLFSDGISKVMAFLPPKLWLLEAIPILFFHEYVYTQSTNPFRSNTNQVTRIFYKVFILPNLNCTNINFVKYLT